MSICQIMQNDFLQNIYENYGRGYDLQDVIFGINFYQGCIDEKVIPLYNISAQKFIKWANKIINKPSGGE